MLSTIAMWVSLAMLAACVLVATSAWDNPTGRAVAWACSTLAIAIIAYVVAVVAH